MTVRICNRYSEAVLYDYAGPDLIKANLSGANLRAANLSAANLNEANLSGANLNEATLNEATLSEATLSEATLNEADLSWANLRWANLSGAKLIGANLNGADLISADLSGADLSGANLNGADLRWAKCLTALGDFFRMCGSRHPIIAIDATNVSIGCERNTLAWWRENAEVLGGKYGYSPAQIEEYKLHLEYAERWLESRRNAV